MRRAMTSRSSAVLLGFAALLGLAGRAPAQSFLNPPADATKTVTDAAKPAVEAPKDVKAGEVAKPEVKLETAYFAGGCFWCMEAVFERLKGVKSVVSGFSGGSVPKPSYEAVCTGLTGHAEVIAIEFDPSIVTYRDLVDLFWLAHDPTTLNRQGPDEGTQYRSVIFYTDDTQRKEAYESYKQATADQLYTRPIVTDLLKLDHFWPADRHHQDYFRKNANSNPYCSAVIAPKLREFKHKLDLKTALKERQQKEKAQAK